MKTIVMGLPYDMTVCSIREVTTFFLFYAIICVVLGRYISKTNIRNAYFVLIRTASCRKLWATWCKNIILLCAGCVCLMGIAVVIVGRIRDVHIPIKVVGTSLLLWFLGFCVLGVFFAACQNLRSGEAISFLFAILIEGVSIFLSYKLPGINNVFIGNYVMLGRSVWMEPDGYRIWFAVMIMFILLCTCSLVGYRIAFRRE